MLATYYAYLIILEVKRTSTETVAFYDDYHNQLCYVEVNLDC
jgi:hypothetical protein